MPGRRRKSPSVDLGGAARLRLASLVLTVGLALGAALPGAATAIVSFSPAPDAPNLPSVTLNGGAQTDTATMANWGVAETVSLSGWNVTVAGDTSAGKSAVFKQYCPNATCGAHSGPGYIAGGNTFAARNGLSYGWSGDNTTWARDRNKLTDQRFDTLVQQLAR